MISSSKAALYEPGWDSHTCLLRCLRRQTVVPRGSDLIRAAFGGCDVRGGGPRAAFGYLPSMKRCTGSTLHFRTSCRLRFLFKCVQFVSRSFKINSLCSKMYQLMLNEWVELGKKGKKTWSSLLLFETTLRNLFPSWITQPVQEPKWPAWSSDLSIKLYDHGNIGLLSILWSYIRKTLFFRVSLLLEPELSCLCAEFNGLKAEKGLKKSLDLVFIRILHNVSTLVWHLLLVWHEIRTLQDWTNRCEFTSFWFCTFISR